jgi:gliding motility-associated-like protein
LYDIPGIYTVLLYSKNVDGVSAVDTVTIEVYGNSSLPAQPTMFSPNGDGVNDLFVFQTKDIVEMDASIVDENGKMVFNCGIGCKWDGKDKQGKDVKVGKYYYMIKAIGVDGKKYERKGIINLTR